MGGQFLDSSRVVCLPQDFDIFQRCNSIPLKFCPMILGFVLLLVAWRDKGWYHIMDIFPVFESRQQLVEAVCEFRESKLALNNHPPSSVH